MATYHMQKEILLVKSSRAINGQNLDRLAKPEPENETLKLGFEGTCWDSLLDEMFPFTVHHTTTRSPLFIWDMYIGQQTICAEIAERPFSYEAFHSINPYVCIAYYHYS